MCIRDSYIAGSRSGKLIKVGSSINTEDRIKKLNSYAYGGVSDWIILASSYLEKSGRIENYIHDKLKLFQVEGSYQKAGRRQQCYELFQCNFDDAYRVLSNLSKSRLKLYRLNIDQIRRHYDFRKS